MDINFFYILLACILGLTMTWSVGANDLANIMSTTMGSKAIGVRTAIVIAIIFEFAGAFLGGSGVSNTLRGGIINTEVLAHVPYLLLYGMLAVLAATSLWMLLASYIGMPISVTNAVVGAIVGFGLIVFGAHAMHWKIIFAILLSWIISPTSAAITAYLLFKSIQKMIFMRPHPFTYSKKYAPYYFFLVGVILANMIIIKGLHHFGIVLINYDYWFISLGSGILIAAFGSIYVARIQLKHQGHLRSHFASSEKIFSMLMALTACAMVFAHGSNDVAIAVGPMAAVITIAESKGQILYSQYVPIWITLLGTFGVVAGFFMYGRKIIATVGEGITNLTPSRAFSATIAAATIVTLSTTIGIPVSATQTLVGGILGVGLARGIGALNMRVVRNIFASWLITIPVSAALTILFFYGFKMLFGVP